MDDRSSGSLVLLTALALDMALGEPPNRLHPVAWLGRLIGALERRAPRDRPGCELIYGAGLTVAGILAAALPALAVERALRRDRTPLHGALPALCAALALKPSFAGRALFRAVAEVRRPLVAGDLAGAREALRSLVSRDTAALDNSLVAAAAIESLAENASDSFVAPLFYYALFGLPGAWAYRAVNTLDAMVGYHGRFEYLGKAPARLDDALNLVPARLTALLIVGASGLAGGDARQSLRAWRRDRARTESPNAGHPMSAIAGALGVCLEKLGHYRLNGGSRPPEPGDIARAERVVACALALAAALCFLACWRKRSCGAL